MSFAPPTHLMPTEPRAGHLLPPLRSMPCNNENRKIHPCSLPCPPLQTQLHPAALQLGAAAVLQRARLHLFRLLFYPSPSLPSCARRLCLPCSFCVLSVLPAFLPVTTVLRMVQCGIASRRQREESGAEQASSSKGGSNRGAETTTHRGRERRSSRAVAQQADHCQQFEQGSAHLPAS